MAIMSQTDFAMMIEEIAAMEKLTHVDAVLKYCAINFIEPSEIAKMIDGSLKDKMRSDFVSMEMLKKTAVIANI